MTTQKRLEKLFSISSFSEGDWFLFQLGTSAGMPRAWVLDAADDYSGPIKALNLVGMSRLRPELSGPMAPIDNELKALQAWCTVVGQSSPPALLSGPTITHHARIVDVGHASCAVIHCAPDTASEIVGYFDVGGPIWFHGRTFPKKFKDASLIPSDGFVALSHWDYDHYSLAITRMKGLQKLTWYAPNQAVGPNAARLQSLLGPRLHFIGTTTFQLGGGLKLWKGTGAVSDRNNSGYVLTVANSNGTTLLTGDVSYNHIPVEAKSNLVALSIAHHGGSGSGNPPLPLVRDCVAAVSFGVPNLYHHPNWTDVQKHTLIGWNVQKTFFTPAIRGDIWLP